MLHREGLIAFPPRDNGLFLILSAFAFSSCLLVVFLLLLLSSGATSTALGQMNMTLFALGRVGTGGVAMSCLNLDTPCTEDMLEEIRKVPDIRNVVQVSQVK